MKARISLMIIAFLLVLQSGVSQTENYYKNCTVIRVYDPALVGTWKLVRFDGKSVERDSDLSQTTWTIARSMIEMKVADQVYKGMFSCDVKDSTNRMLITLEGEPGEAAAIYKFEDGKLIVKLNDVGNLGYAKDFEVESHYDVYEFIKVD